jgi:DNA-binding NarL/FixJ family response regulator
MTDRRASGGIPGREAAARPSVFAHRNRRTLAERIAQARVEPTKIRAELRGEAATHHGRPTQRDLDVIVALVENSSGRAAAEALGITEQTVKNHVSAVIHKLGARSRTHATWLLWPQIGHRLGGPRPDRRSGHERRQVA